METTDNQPFQEMQKSWESEKRRGKIMGGAILILIGGLLLLREIDPMALPYWLFSWKTFLIVLGIYMAIKSGNRSIGWIFPILIGTSLILADLYPDLVNRAFLWPSMLIVLGFIIIFKPKGSNRWKRFRHIGRYGNSYRNVTAFEENGPSNHNVGGGTIEITAFFGGVTNSVISKDFRKGEINAVFGGAEVNFSNADMVERADLEINAVLGGVKLIIPSNWEVRSEVNCIMGGVEDKRAQRASDLDGPRKLLVLEGNAVLGGIEIKSF